MLPDDGPYETIAGLILVIAGKIPQVGESFKIRGHVLTVAKMDGRRIEKVLISTADSAEAAPLSGKITGQGHHEGGDQDV